MRHLLVCLICSCVTCGWTLAQTLTTNDAGEQIIVYPDGSWRYFNQAPPEEPEPVESGPVEEETYEDPDLLAEAEARARSIIRKRTQQQLTTLSRTKKELARAKKKEIRELERVAKLRSTTGTTDRDKLEIATRKLQESRRVTLQLQEVLKEEEKFAEILERALPMTRERRAEYFASTGVMFNEELDDFVHVNSSAAGSSDDQIDVAPAIASRSEVSRSQSVSKERRKYDSYDIREDPRYTPPSSTCVYTYDGVDEFTQSRRIDVAPEIFFAYTTPELKPYLGSNSLVTAKGNLVQSGGYVILELQFTIRSQFASREFGVLPKSSQLSIKLVEGSTVTLKNQRLAQGNYDPVEKVYTYSGRYQISSGQRKSLERDLVDQVRVTWGTGFEDYPVFEVDFFQRQFACL